MGNALVVMTVPEESLPMSALRIAGKDGKPVPVPGLGGWPWKPREELEATLVAHPDAFWILHVPRSAVWDPPGESGGLATNRVARKVHAGQVRHSLLHFLNDKLAELDGMVRTGWWILQRARIRLATFEGQP